MIYLSAEAFLDYYELVDEALDEGHNIGTAEKSLKAGLDGVCQALKAVDGAADVPKIKKGQLLPEQCGNHSSRRADGASGGAASSSS